jgi:hypothetical protein
MNSTFDSKTPDGTGREIGRLDVVRVRHPGK